MTESARKDLFLGIAGGLVAWWAVDRLYSRSRTASNGAAPCWIGAAIGAAYGGLVLRRYPAALARVPVVAAVHSASGGAEADARPKGGSVLARLASRGLRSVTERTLFR